MPRDRLDCVRHVVVLAMILLAGCSQSEPAEPVLDDSPDALGIRGVVVDNAIIPIAGANVTITGTNFTATTDDDGLYEVPVAAPGSLELRISKDGFIPVTSIVTLNEGDGIIDHQTILEAIPYLEPSSEVKQWDGLIQCGVRTPEGAFALCAVGGLLGDDSEERYEEIDTPPTIVQSELIWTHTQTLGESLRLMYTDDHREGLDNYRVAQGTSPIAVRADNKTLQFKHLDTQGLFIRVYTGDYQDLGVSLTLQQTFQVFTSVYHNYAPPEDWMFVDSDSLYPPP